jgi:hypothetical protein
MMATVLSIVMSIQMALMVPLVVWWVSDYSAGIKYSATYLSNDKFYETFKVFKQHLNDKGPYLLIEALENDSMKIKWLSIGSGFGDMELKIFQMIRESNLNIFIDVLECFEPGNVQFQQLQKINFSTEQVPILHNEPFQALTDLESKKYDVITMFHVHYYWTSPKERIQVMKKLFHHLSPGGLLFILILEKGIDNQIALRKFTKNMLIFDHPRDWKSEIIYGSEVKTEIETIFEPNVVEMNQYQLSLDLNLSQIDDKTSTTNAILSYILSVDFFSLHSEVKKTVVNWIGQHCHHHKNEEIYQLRQAASALIIRKK